MIKKGLFKFASAIFMLSSVSIATNASTASNKTPTNIVISNFAHSGYEFTLGVVYLQPGANNLGWSATTTVLPIPTPQWKIHTLNPTYQPGFNLGVRYLFGNIGTDIQANWTHLSTSDTSYVAVDPATQWVSPFSQTGTPPTGGEITGVASLKTATGQVKFNYDVVNVDAGKYLDIGSLLQLRLFTGLSGLHIREELFTSFYGLPKVAFTLNNTTTYTGLGPRIGIDNIFHLYDGLNLAFQFAGSFLIGTMQPAQYKFTGTGSALSDIGITTNNENLSSSSTTQIVPAVDTKLGMNYLFNMRHDSILTIELGWSGALYINPLSSYETNTNVIALDSGSLSTASVKYTQSNFSVTGPYLTASLLF